MSYHFHLKKLNSYSENYSQFLTLFYIQYLSNLNKKCVGP
ncbi:hypothetical protein CLU83_3777 [Flavobacterium sp. 1]|nr:hypothetical protein CLU83_3777 [Flavobacterium sp. 1]